MKGRGRRSQRAQRARKGLAGALFAACICLLWARAGQTDTATLVRGRSDDSDCGPAPRVCVLPFFDSQAPDGFDPDLAAILEASLRQEPGLRIVSIWTERRSVHQVEPWLVRSAWPAPEQGAEADVYFRLRRVWVERAVRLAPSDFWVSGRIVRTGSLLTLLADIFPASGVRMEAMASFSKEAPQAEAVPAAIRELAAAMAAVLGKDRTRRCLGQAWARYRSGSWPIERAIEEAQARVDGQPDCLECRLLLLGLLREGGESYAEQAEKTARSLVAAWRDWTDETRRTAAENDFDPFLVLCEHEAAQADWAAVEITARLGAQTIPLNSRRYAKWRARSLLERGLWEEARRELEDLARYAPTDPEIKGWLDETAEGIRNGRVEEKSPLEGVENKDRDPTPQSP